MKRCRFLGDEAGAAMLEMTLIFPLLMALSFGVVEFGLAYWKFAAAEKATQIGARWASVRGPVYTFANDCFIASGDLAGTNCADVAGADAWSATCTSSSGACQAAEFTAMVTEMRKFAPFIQPTNVQVVLRGSKLGFVGRGKAMPIITVRLIGLTHQWLMLKAFPGLSDFTLPGFDATTVGEDQSSLGPT